MASKVPTDLPWCMIDSAGDQEMWTPGLRTGQNTKMDPRSFPTGSIKSDATDTSSAALLSTPTISLLPQGINVIQRSFVYLFKVAALNGGFLCLVGTTFYAACLWDVIDTWYI